MGPFMEIILRSFFGDAQRDKEEQHLKTGTVTSFHMRVKIAQPIT